MSISSDFLFDVSSAELAWTCTKIWCKNEWMSLFRTLAAMKIANRWITVQCKLAQETCASFLRKFLDSVSPPLQLAAGEPTMTLTAVRYLRNRVNKDVSSGAGRSAVGAEIWLMRSRQGLQKTKTGSVLARTSSNRTLWTHRHTHTPAVDATTNNINNCVLFSTNVMDTVEICQDYFNFELPSSIAAFGVARWQRHMGVNNLPSSSNCKLRRHV